ncbi:hypothetical protein AVEN_63757-1 [Araneus ventricosus]|uniref:Uncharacterized protein n=1 Tax=Araneus ventricosus TaxID=182803 RepID=A0A4Y2KRV5_ARAVE|nr:hypothetical protein AVEN_63757-1 [Araneus ventricosus]
MANLSEMDVVLHGSLRKDFPTEHVPNHQMLSHLHKNPTEHGSPQCRRCGFLNLDQEPFSNRMMWTENQAQVNGRLPLQQDHLEQFYGSFCRGRVCIRLIFKESNYCSRNIISRVSSLNIGFLKQVRPTCCF